MSVRAPPTVRRGPAVGTEGLAIAPIAAADGRDSPHFSLRFARRGAATSPERVTAILTVNVAFGGGGAGGRMRYPGVMSSPPLVRSALVFGGAFLGGLVSVALLAPTLATAQPRAANIPSPPQIPVAPAAEQRVAIPAQGIVYVDGATGREVMRVRPSGQIELTDPSSGKATVIAAGSVRVSRGGGGGTDRAELDADGFESVSQPSGGLGVGGANANVVRAGATPSAGMKPGVTTRIAGRTWSSP